MSRRDTIIIAVLVNAALLMILFTTAIRPKDASKDKEKGERVTLANKASTKQTPHDDLLSEYVITIPPHKRGHFRLVFNF